MFGATNGTVILSSRTAQFTTTVGTNALASFMFKVTDASGFAYTNTVNVHIIVPPTNNAPNLSAVANRTINVGVNLSITNLATDADTPAQTLTFSLPTAPTNAILNTNSGMLNWRPLVTQANSTNPFAVVVTDNGSPNLSATQSFNVIVNPFALPGVAADTILTNGQFGLSVNGQIGPDYAVQRSTNFINWDTLFITNPTTMPFTWKATNTTMLPSQFYRIKIGPPLP